MDVVDIVNEWLTANGYDGLYVSGECACEVGDLVPCCGDGFQSCEAGYKTECDCGDDHNFHIGPDKPPRRWWAKIRGWFGYGKEQSQTG